MVAPESYTLFQRECIPILKSSSLKKAIALDRGVAPMGQWINFCVSFYKYVVLTGQNHFCRCLLITTRKNVPRVGIVVNSAKPPVNDPCPTRDSIFVEKKTNTNLSSRRDDTFFMAIEIFRKD